MSLQVTLKGLSMRAKSTYKEKSAVERVPWSQMMGGQWRDARFEGNDKGASRSDSWSWFESPYQDGSL